MATGPERLGDVLTRAVVSPRPQSKPASSLENEINAWREALTHDPSLGEVWGRTGLVVPKKYRHAKLEDFGADMVKPNEDGLFITGATGTGKTHLATAWIRSRIPDSVCIAANEIQVAFKPMRWTSAPELLGRLRGTFGRKDGETEESIISELSGAWVIVLDDLGAEQSTDWTGQALYRLLCRRINECRPTIVTSNLTLEEMDKRDPRLASRLGGMAYQKLEGKDRRLERAAQ